MNQGRNWSQTNSGIPGNTVEFGLKLFCSPDGEEQTIITYDRARQAFIVDFEKASNDKTLEYPRRVGAQTAQHRQVVPYRLADTENLRLDLFVDRSVVKAFVNSEICLVQRVYPMRDDSKQFRLFTTNGALTVQGIVKWEMDVTNPW